MRRRQCFTLFGCIATWSTIASAQQLERMRRIGVLMNRGATDPEGQGRLAAFQNALQQAGWSIGQNVRIDTRWGEDDLDLEAKYAAELIALAPDIIFASGSLGVASLQRLSRTLPIVFVGV